MNRLYTHIKNEQKSTGNILGRQELGFEELSTHHIVSDLQADVNWKNFESLFDAFFERDALAALAGHDMVSFPKGTRIFSPETLEELYQKIQEN